MPLNYWTGDVPTQCEVGQHNIGKVFIDGKMLGGPWAIMCAACHDRYGSGLGTGKGQKYQRAADGNLWIMVAG